MRLRARLARVLDALEPSAADFISLIEEMTAVDAPLTPEQFAEMSRRRQEAAAGLTQEERAAMSRRREEVMATLTPEQIEEMRRERARWVPVPGS